MTKNIKFTNMGVFNGCQIEWINALTGEAIDTTEKISDSFGHLKLEFPDTLTGNATCPIMFFKLYRIDATFLAPIIPDENQTSLPANFVKDESTYPIEQTDWSISTKNDLNLTISPAAQWLSDCVIIIFCYPLRSSCTSAAQWLYRCVMLNRFLIFTPCQQVKNIR